MYEIFGTEQLFMNSYHHQAIKKAGTDIRISARGKDGIIEAVEPENYPFCVGMQW